MSQIKHLLFDNDGTVVDSEILAVRVMLRMLKPHGLSMHEDDYCRRFPGLLTRDILVILEQDHGVRLPPDFLKTLHEEHIRVFEAELQPVPGMDTLFRRLKTPKSMVSNGSVRHVERSLRRVGLLPALDGHIFSAPEHTQRVKPHPDIYLHSIEKLGLTASELLAVEDSEVGVAAAKSAGLRTIGFLGATHIRPGFEETLKRAGADYISTDARALETLLGEMGVS